ncbi:MAG: citrate/2-methylcitrate synthase [Ruminococcus sp.]|nr:citrate/2-methylcitrate synthase [Ruminococcus sp.]
MNTVYSKMENVCNNLKDSSKIEPNLYEKFHVKRGLRRNDGTGVIAGITNICNVHGYVINEGEKEPAEGELIYRGYNVKDLVENVEKEDRFGFEETIYLLLFGELPNIEQLEEFTQYLSINRPLPEGFFADMIMKAPSNNIMNKMSRSILALYSYDNNAEDMSLEGEMRKALNLIAKLPVIMVDALQVKRLKFDNKSMIMHPIREYESTAQTILSLLRPNREYSKEEAQLLDILLMLHAEHGGGNNSTFSCRVLTSSGTDAYATYSAAIGSLKGSRHGGANMKVVKMVEDFRNNVQDWNDEGQVADHLRKIINKEAYDHSGLVYGMGHAVYTLSDPRAVILKKKAFELAKDTEFEREFNLINNIEKLTPTIFKEVKGSDKVMCANVDLYSGFVYRMLGIPEDIYTPLFASARIAGWSAHRMEEMLTGNRIIRPAYKAIAKNKPYVPLCER